MNHRQISQSHRLKSPAYRPAFERLDAALEENTPSDNYEKIRRMRLAYFADVDELQKSGSLKIPKQEI
jgi:hypothetical protein